MLKLISLVLVGYILFAALSLNTLVGATKHNAAIHAALMEQ